MAKLMRRSKQRKEERGAIIPVPRLAAFPWHIPERVEEFFREPWGPGWPSLRWPEETVRMPAVDVFEDGDEVVVKAELPGMKKEEVDVQIAGDVITISGKKEKEERVEKKDYHRYERSSGSFSRSVRLPAEVQVDRVTAKLEEGVLEIRAAKSEAAKARTRKIVVS
jgi:HSP20 family protein